MTAALAASTLDFELPPDLEAVAPPEARGLARDGVRLLVSYRAKDGAVHAHFRDLPEFLDPGDVVVVNNSETLPAALRARRSNGRELPLHLSTALPGGLWVVEPRLASLGEHDGSEQHRGPNPLAAGETLDLPGGARATLLGPYRGSRGKSARLWLARLDLPGPLIEYLRTWGKPIAYPYVTREWPLAAYQTMFAAEPGSAEMPSAGRAFTPEVVSALERKGVRLAQLTLHTGVASPERDEPPYEEFYRVPPETAAAVNAARRSGSRVIAVGTTVVRALESAADSQGRVAAARGWTDLVITPERGVRAVDGLLTGFHEPRASHLAMLEALAGQAHLRKAYRAALEAGYLWHEFGDLHLIL